MSNSIFTISPYMHDNMWVFDDQQLDLVKEPFISGIDTMITDATNKLKLNNPEAGFNLIFSSEPFPSYDFHLVKKEEQYNGNWYSCEELGIKGWLCPALYKYFPNNAPKDLYIALKDNV